MSEHDEQVAVVEWCDLNGVSKSTAERILSDLLAKGKVKKLGAGPAAAHVKVEQR